VPGHYFPVSGEGGPAKQLSLLGPICTYLIDEVRRADRVRIVHGYRSCVLVRTPPQE